MAMGHPQIHPIPIIRLDYHGLYSFPYQNIAKSLIFHPNCSPPCDNHGMPLGGSASIAPGAHLWANGENHPAAVFRAVVRLIWAELSQFTSLKQTYFGMTPPTNHNL
jgi:hypothetical protein